MLLLNSKDADSNRLAARFTAPDTATDATSAAADATASLPRARAARRGRRNHMRSRHVVPSHRQLLYVLGSE